LLKQKGAGARISREAGLLPRPARPHWLRAATPRSSTGGLVMVAVGPGPGHTCVVLGGGDGVSCEGLSVLFSCQIYCCTFLSPRCTSRSVPPLYALRGAALRVPIVLRQYRPDSKLYHGTRDQFAPPPTRCHLLHFPAPSDRRVRHLPAPQYPIRALRIRDDGEVTVQRPAILWYCEFAMGHLTSRLKCWPTLARDTFTDRRGWACR